MFKILSVATIVFSLLAVSLNKADAKGNRKISLTISGRIHQSVMIWDDGLASSSSAVNASKKKKQSSKGK